MAFSLYNKFEIKFYAGIAARFFSTLLATIILTSIAIACEDKKNMTTEGYCISKFSPLLVVELQLFMPFLFVIFANFYELIFIQ